MPPNHLIFPILVLLIVAAGSDTAHAKKKYLLGAGSGGQIHLGPVTPLPLQPALTPGVTGPVFPPLLIPIRPGAVVETTMGTLTIPKGVLLRAAAQTTFGVAASSPTKYAVATNLSVSWPAAKATLSKGKNPIQPGFANAAGGTITYSNVLAAKFGGPARFAFSPGPSAGLAAAPVTTYFNLAAGGVPPCTHSALGGGSPNDTGCVAVVGVALPTGTRPIGGLTNGMAMTPGGPAPAPNIYVAKIGTAPPGTILAAVAAGTTAITDALTSYGFPFTTGKIVVKQPGVTTHSITGMDNRVAGMGTGTLHMVAGGLTQRTLTGPRTSRAWIRLELINTVTKVFIIDGMSTGGDWDWKIDFSSGTVAEKIGVGALPFNDPASAFADKFIASINANLGMSGCGASPSSDPLKTDHFEVSCPENFDFWVQDTGLPLTLCKVANGATTGPASSSCPFNPTISLAGSSVPLFDRRILLVLAVLLLATYPLIRRVGRNPVVGS